MVKNNQISISGAMVFKESKGKIFYFLVATKDGSGWEIAKVTVRKGESSVRAAIRMTSEQGGMNARVLEEAGRASGAAIINGKSVPQKLYYYLMLYRAGGEVIGFDKFQWLDYSNAFKKLTLKREKEMLKSGREVLKTWEKSHKIQNY